ncbi:MAG: hypothetical protein JWQ90_3615 [Hydrocarboniphaga sp.]|uniref:DUF1329 domain-containing protein n=1 Tax=Hydrocarboniphaga sp. TaxID=2033016 RepID=UPI002603FB14|nr:DUF1329 domain-containing protein [Hydrocarboniphaga sp.]MDB5971165.1 hypothetical protein [Hydrocarboniphaga sp.]
MMHRNRILAGIVAATISMAALAGATPEEAKKLGGELTPFGAEAGANSDGSIPAYDGGLAAMKSLPKTNPSKASYPDPFADEKPLFKITAQNIAQYKDQVTPGLQALIKRYPDYYLNVYPTRRTASYPDWVNANTLKNATNAKLVGDIDGDGVEGAYGGIPFPIPKSGTEVIWNHYLRWQGTYRYNRTQNFLIDTGGGVTDLGDLNFYYAHPYYDKTKDSLPDNRPFYTVAKTVFDSPVTVAGTAYLFQYPLNFAKQDQVTWFYSPGQRRVRRAPEFKYDTPVASYGGACTYDEIDGIAGRLDRFEWKIVGKKEMYLQYNNYKLNANVINRTQAFTPKYENPAMERWEKHRVWVVEGKLRAGARHAASRKTLYFDEDTWALYASESYDQAGNIWRVGSFSRFLLYPETVAEGGFAGLVYDFSKGNYLAVFYHATDADRIEISTKLPNMSTLSPEAMSGMGVQ